MDWIHVGHGLGMWSFGAALMTASWLGLLAINRFLLNKRKRDKTYIIVETSGRRTTVTLRAEYSPLEQEDEARQAVSGIQLGL